MNREKIDNLKAKLFSRIYRSVRNSAIQRTYRRQEKANIQRIIDYLPVYPYDLEEVVELGDRRLKFIDRFLGSLVYDFRIPDDLEAQLYDLKFPSPLTLASFKGDLDIVGIWLRLGLGGAILKTAMKNSREGNPRPRLQQLDNGCLLNCMGLPGKGIDGFLEDFASFSEHHNNFVLSSPGIISFEHQYKPIGFSIGGNSVEEYEQIFRKIERDMIDKDISYFYEINPSCPNTKHGMQLITKPELLEELLDNMRRSTDRIIGIKLSPAQSDTMIVEFTRIAKKFERTYINVGNSRPVSCADVSLPINATSLGGGGLSGPSLYPRTRDMVELVSSMRIPIIATGGVDSAEKVLEIMNLGANIVGMATAVVHDMYCIPLINRELSDLKRSEDALRNRNNMVYLKYD